MRKTVLTLLILSSFLLARVQAQTNDSLNTKVIKDSLLTIYTNKRAYTYLQIRSGLLGGFQFVKSDSAYITLAIPFEYNFRFFPKYSSHSYIDLSIGGDYLMLNKDILIRAFGGNLGYGQLSRTYNTNYQFHVGYLYGITKKNPALNNYRDMLVVGYIFETSSIPLNIDLIMPFREKFSFKTYLWLVGVKVSILNNDISKKKPENLY